MLRYITHVHEVTDHCTKQSTQPLSCDDSVAGLSATGVDIVDHHQNRRCTGILWLIESYCVVDSKACHQYVYSNAQRNCFIFDVVLAWDG